MEAKIFAAPEAEVVRFPKQDVVTTSGVVDPSGDPVPSEPTVPSTPVDVW